MTHSDSFSDAMLSSVMAMPGVLVSPDPVTARARGFSQGSGGSPEVEVVSGRLDDVQARAFSVMMREASRRIVARRENSIVENVFSLDNSLKYRMVPFLGEGDNCCTFLGRYFPVGCVAGIPATAYALKHPKKS